MLRTIFTYLVLLCSCFPLWGQEHLWNAPFFINIDLAAGSIRYDMQIDEAGNTYVLGLFEDEVSILDSTFYTTKEDGVFLAKFDTDHNFVWAKIIAEAKRESPASRVIANTHIEIEGNTIYPVVEYEDSILLNGQLFTVEQTQGYYNDIAIFKMSDTGNVEDIYHIKGNCQTGYGGMKIQDGYLYFHIQNLRYNTDTDSVCTCSINSDTTIYSPTKEAILGRINQGNSSVDWVKTYKAGNGVTSVISKQIAVNESSLYITGRVGGSDDLVFDEDSIIVNYTRYGYISRFDLEGHHKWTKYYGVDGWDSNPSSRDIELNSDNDIVLLANLRTQSVMNRVFFHDGSYLTGAQNNDESFFIVNYDSLGNIKWKDISESIGYEACRSLALDSDKNVYVTGKFTSPLTFGSETLDGYSFSNDIFVVSYDQFGNKRWASEAGGFGSDIGSVIRIDSSDHIHVMGGVTSESTFGAYEATPPSSGYSIFVAQMRVEPIGLEETTPQQFGVSVYPNPSLGQIQIQVQDEFISQVKIYNGFGQKIKNLNFDSQTDKVSVENLPSGYYILDIHVESGKHVAQKLIVK